MTLSPSCSKTAVRAGQLTGPKRDWQLDPLPKILLIALLALASALPAGAQWQRVVLSGKGEKEDTAAAHSLKYFTANPALRDDGQDLGRPHEYSFRTVTKPVGELAGYRILDVLCYVRGRGTALQFASGDQVKWKFILVRTGPDRYREIFHLQALYTTVSLTPSRIVHSGGERVLATMDSDGGNGGGCWEDYWWFDKDGPHALDFSRVRAAIKTRTPENTVTPTACANLDLAAQRITTWVQKANPSCHACDFLGELTAEFRLDGPIALPSKIDYKPGDPQQ